MIYTAVLRVIEKGGYDKQDMLDKLDVYLLCDRITQDQYQELAGKLA